MLPEGRNKLPCLLGIDRSRLVVNRKPELFQRFRRLPGPHEQEREVKTDDGGVRELARQRPQPSESANRRPLREGANGGRAVPSSA